MKSKIFVDGQEGTTGLEIHKRLELRTDIEVLKAPCDKRKDINTRKELLNAADIAFLCLPDDAAKEAVSLIENKTTRIIDASTAHRVSDSWVYGIPELSAAHKNQIRAAKRLSVPGCFATGFVMLMYPLIKYGLIPLDYPATCHSITGYSGRGSRFINEFEQGDSSLLKSPCFYALELNHKHLPEMQKHTGLIHPPLFTPIIANFNRGMVVACPIIPGLLPKKRSVCDIAAFFADYYKNQTFVKVYPLNINDSFNLGFLDACACNHTNNIEIMTFGLDERILLIARLDNLGKGASGAAVQNMNIMLGLDEGEGLRQTSKNPL